MRILLINEYAESRGTEQIVQEQLKIFKYHGHQVQCLCFAFNPFKRYNYINDDYHIIPIPKIGKIFFLPHIYLKLRRYITQINPEIIILHNIFSSPFTVYKALNGYNVYQIVHDYKIVCPTSYCILLRKTNAICTGYKHNICTRECTTSIINSIKLKIKLALVRQVEKLRKKYVKKLIAPSSHLCDTLKKYGYESYLLNNPIEINKPLRLKKNLNKVKKVIYVGGLNFEKGILPFAKKLLNETQCILDIYGGAKKGWYSKTLLELVEKNKGRIKYWGNIEHEALMKKMQEYDFVVVPSLWVDNYPTIILESMINSVCVIASNRGGAVDLLSNKRGLLFEWQQDNSLTLCLSELESMSIEKYNDIVTNAYKYVCKNNDYKAYYENFFNIITTQNNN